MVRRFSGCPSLGLDYEEDGPNWYQVHYSMGLPSLILGLFLGPNP